MLKVFDFMCSDCDTRIDDVLTDNGKTPDELTCAACGGVSFHRLYGMKPPITIVKGNHDYRERERERLEKRSQDHYAKEGRHEAIAIGRKFGL